MYVSIAGLRDKDRKVRTDLAYEVSDCRITQNCSGIKGQAFFSMGRDLRPRRPVVPYAWMMLIFACRLTQFTGHFLSRDEL